MGIFPLDKLLQMLYRYSCKESFFKNIYKPMRKRSRLKGIFQRAVRGWKDGIGAFAEWTFEAGLKCEE